MITCLTQWASCKNQSYKQSNFRELVVFTNFLISTHEIHEWFRPVVNKLPFFAGILEIKYDTKTDSLKINTVYNKINAMISNKYN